MKKGLFLLLIPFLVSMGFIGCKDDKSTTSGEISVWTQMEPKEQEIFDNFVKNFEEKNENISVKVMHYKTEDLRSSYITASSGGKGPDIIYGPADNVGVLATLKGGLIKPLDKFLDKKFVDSFFSPALANFKYNGKTWGLPDRVGNHLMVVANVDLIDPQNVPVSFDDIINTYASEEDPEVWPLVFFAKEPFWLIPFYGGFGGSVFKNGNEPSLNNDAMIQALTLIKELQDKHIIPPNVDGDDADALFREGKAKMIINGDWQLGLYQDEMNIRTYPIPQMTDGQYGAPYTSSKGYSVNVNVSDDKMEIITTFLEYILGYEQQKVWTDNVSVLAANEKLFQENKKNADDIIKGSLEQLSYGVAMPTIPEMRAVWDSIGPELQAVLNGTHTPEEAAENMQKTAVEKINTMHGN